jgi:hypothetical protein
MARPKGSVTRRSITLAAFLHTEGCDPAKILADLTQSEDPEMRHKAANSLMPYAYPKLSSIEMKGEIDITKPLVILNGISQK